MIRTWFLTVVLALAGLPLAAQATVDLSELNFLLGDWQAVETAPGETGGSTFALQVQNRVIVRTNEASYPAAGGRPASRHDDLMVIYAEKGSIKADYFDNEGHVIRYAVRPQGTGRVVFTSDTVPREPRYRLTYTLAPDGALKGSFAIAPPDSPEAFKPYLDWTARKK